jgi:SAM-dependent methyltransferase
MPRSDRLYARPVTVERVEDCHFYHVMELPDGGVVGGQFDLRGGEDAYLGHVDLEGRRVLEIGPASGFLTFHMEANGASVVAVELGPNAEWDIVPQEGLDLTAIRAGRRQIMEELRNGFWWAHKRMGSLARVHYGNVYSLPDELGEFDVALMAAILRHTRDPLRIVEACARHARTVVITEMYFPELDDLPVIRLVPSRASAIWDTWWDLTPDLPVRFLGILGFRPAVVTYHDQPLLVDDAIHQIPFFHGGRGPVGKGTPASGLRGP